MESTTELPDVLYHYCGVDAFRGIITSKKLRLSNIYWMNDYKEFSWLLGYANRYISQEKKRHSEPFYRHIPVPLTLNRVPYVACFSESGDLLSQWRAYSDDGAGFAIGFDGEFLFNRAGIYGPYCPMSLRKVEYSKERQHKDVRDLLANTFRTAEKCKGQIGYEKESLDAVLWALIRLWQNAAESKNPAFAEEKEWRVVLLAELDEHGNVTDRSMPSKTAFRTSRARIIPYCEFDFGTDVVPPRNPIKRIVLGPKNYARARKDELKLLLMQSGYQADKIKIVNSKASYQ
jgi:hypothetical protein